MGLERGERERERREYGAHNTTSVFNYYVLFNNQLNNSITIMTKVSLGENVMGLFRPKKSLKYK